MNRVAVTGVGLICALGNTAAECWNQMRAGKCGIAPLLDRGHPPYKFQTGAEARTFDPLRYFTERDLIVLERFALLAAAAAREAVAQSGLRFEGELAEETAVITASSVGGQFSEEEGYRRLYKDGNPRVAPLTIPRTMTNAGASRISLEFGIVGPTYTVATACSSSNHAIGQAFWMIRHGQVKAAIAGGSEAVFAEGLLRAWEAMRVVSPEPCRPFSATRKGLSLGEGAGMLVLEEWEHARKRGATILGEMAGFGLSSDAHHITQPCVQGPARSMRWALRDAGLAPEDIDYINAHGTGTQANDITESQAIHSVWGAHASDVWVSSTKSMHGHTLGAAGAVEAIATLLSLRDGLLPPTVSCPDPDPECNLRLITQTALEAKANAAITNTFAFGGLNATLVIKRADV